MARTTTLSDTELFKVVDVSDWPLAPFEPVGRKQNKRWLRAPEDVHWLFKEVTTQQLPDGRTWPKGEDWAEKIVAELATLLGVPVANVELAVRQGINGSISLDLTRGGESPLSMGNELLAGFVPGYEASKFHRIKDYTVENVLTAFNAANVEPPVEADQGLGAGGWFAGYLILDALVANTDRHHQNWGVLFGEGLLTLAPSFDHASSLGFQLSDDDRTRQLEIGIDHFALRGRSRHTPGRPTFVALATRAAVLTGTVTYWRAMVESVDRDDVDSLVGAIPDGSMSHAARTFVRELVAFNRRRLIDALDAA